MVEVLATTNLTEDEVAQLNALVEKFPVDSSIAILLQRVLSARERGIDLAILDSDAELTPNEAAELLQMSRPHLLGFMDAGQLPFHRVGSHRRIRTSDLLDFIDRRERANATVGDSPTRS